MKKFLAGGVVGGIVGFTAFPIVVLLSTEKIFQNAQSISDRLQSISEFLAEREDDQVVPHS